MDTKKVRNLINLREKIYSQIQILHHKRRICEKAFFNTKSSNEKNRLSLKIEAIQSILSELDDEFNEVEAIYIKAARELNP